MHNASLRWSVVPFTVVLPYCQIDLTNETVLNEYELAAREFTPISTKLVKLDYHS